MENSSEQHLTSKEETLASEEETLTSALLDWSAASVAVGATLVVAHCPATKPTSRSGHWAPCSSSMPLQMSDTSPVEFS
jgi:hypothetical protein